MTVRFEPIPTAVFFAAVLGWLTFVAVFALGKKPPAAPARQRDRVSLAGIVLQGASYALIWMGFRPPFTPIVPMLTALELALGAATVLLIFASVWLVWAAVRTLGQQWSLVARLTEGHRLVTEGPYRLVRHPIYTGMLGMLLSTGVAASRWFLLPPAVLLFGIGTAIRVRSEEKLLRQAFPAEYESYARRVAAVIPWML